MTTQSIYKEGTKIKCTDERVDSIGYFGTPVYLESKTDITFRVVINFKDGNSHQTILKSDDWEKEASEFLDGIK